MKLTPLIRVLAVTLLTVAFTSAQAAPVTFQGNLSTAGEALPNVSEGTGTATAIFDSALHTMEVLIVFSGLTGTTTMSHIHAATALAGSGSAGVATELPSFTGFPLGVTSGSYDHTFDTSLTATWNPTFLANNGGTAASAEAAFLQALTDGKAYLNIHTTYKPGGEVRAFLNRVPDTGATLSLLALSLGGLALAARRSPRRTA